ncbi:hypothetical protein O3620_01055 [Streptococcus sp. 27098_8_134]|jgi:putative uncharacterized protein gbs1142|uniref:Uncharacterized protein n=1 Tax=Streptococcus sanguinis TaxID=1305 RepID=A0AAJ5NPP2_STRSA|nr:hypothetical protein [Streptococcus sanguinis]RKV95121.1 MAG: hypothetical protein D8H99_25980 [Streptococcus sp.]RSI47302.1 hypothetical protein D8873_02750 [Streptococcus sanguinis]RSI68542.1 hypothetical protein D8861_02750 [Streptococcus sanguinis]VDY71549.1 Uncharacterised protein [Streptococcus sanguinis]
METAVKVFQMLQIIVGITGLVWVLVGVIEFFGGRNNNDSMRQEKGANSMINGGAVGVIAVSVCQAIITALNSIPK